MPKRGDTLRTKSSKALNVKKLRIVIDKIEKFRLNFSKPSFMTEPL